MKMKLMNKQVNFSFHIACTLITWIAFGMCIRITKAVNDTLFRYNEGTEASLPLPLVARYGNAVWLALVSAVRTLPLIVALFTAYDKDLPPHRHRPIWDQDICTTGQIRNRLPY
jgi:hypothetical protein